MTYNILAINPGHNGSMAFLVDGELQYYIEEERLSRLKYDGNPFKSMIQILINFQVDELVIGGTSNDYPKLPWTGEDPYTALVRKFHPGVKVVYMGGEHHLGHAAGAFYNSGFDTAAAVVVDGAGSIDYSQVSEDATIAGFETESIYYCSYPHEFNPIYKRYSDGSNGSSYYHNGIQEFISGVTLTKAYEAVSDYLGFTYIEAGKTMGLAPYGQDDDNIPDIFINGVGNKNLLIPNYPAGANIDENYNPYLKRSYDPKEWHTDFTKCPDIAKNLAYKVQKETEEQIINLIQKAIDLTGENNVVLAGGYGLNCVANYKIIKHFPDINFYVDPVSHDGGTAIGLAKLAWYAHEDDTSIRPLSSLYLAASPNYDELSLLDKYNDTMQVEDTDVESIADLIIDGNIVALFQGRAEAGPRALGNRSILFDPRHKDGKDIVNEVKHREWFRPFAGSVLEDHASEWFEMEGLKSSPFMMYAVDVKTDKVDQIPAVTHVDNTCRVQTVNHDQNEHYYNLINKFYEKTGVPVLFNTSFNLGGEPLVDTVIDALNTLMNSDIKYLYLPEIGKLVTKL